MNFHEFFNVLVNLRQATQCSKVSWQNFSNANYAAPGKRAYNVHIDTFSIYIQDMALTRGSGISTYIKQLDDLLAEYDTLSAFTYQIPVKPTDSILTKHELLQYSALFPECSMLSSPTERLILNELLKALMEEISGKSATQVLIAALQR